MSIFLRRVLVLVAMCLCLSTGAAYPQSVQDGTPARQVYDGPEWVKFGCSTYPLTVSSDPRGTGAQDPDLVYDPARFWDAGPDSEHLFEGYRWARETWTDSAAAATALATGRKTFRGAINWSDLDGPLFPTVVEFARIRGRTTGTISSVPFSHATPAGLSNAHGSSRKDYGRFAREMVYGTGGTVQDPAPPMLDVIMGCGHPGFDDDGHPASNSTDYVGGDEAWADMGAGAGGTTSSGFQVFHVRAAFEALASDDGATGRHLGIPEVHSTLQARRSGLGASKGSDAAPYTDARNEGVPSLETMTRAALNVLDGTSDRPNDAGFFLHVEGGAVDWAAHNNSLGREIEEQLDFTGAIEAVDDYLRAGTHGNDWTNTLVILVADHETGLLLGPKADEVPYDGLVDQGAGTMPRHRYLSFEHTNSLVPLYARGPGSESFARKVDGIDPEMVGRYGLWQGFDGRYVDNTDVAEVIFEALDGDGHADARNVILMISDGAGFNAWTAATMYRYGAPRRP